MPIHATPTVIPSILATSNVIPTILATQRVPITTTAPAVAGSWILQTTRVMTASFQIASVTALQITGLVISTAMTARICGTACRSTSIVIGTAVMMVIVCVIHVIQRPPITTSAIQTVRTMTHVCAAMQIHVTVVRVIHVSVAGAIRVSVAMAILAIVVGAIRVSAGEIASYWR